MTEETKVRQKEETPNLAAAGLTVEQEKLLAQLQAVKTATATAVCPDCGSSLHKRCTAAAR